MGTDLGLCVPDELLERVVELIAERLAERLAGGSLSRSSPYLDVDESAAYLRCDSRRIYDLRGSGRLECVRDGRRLLFTREALDRCLTADSPSGSGSGNGFAGKPPAHAAGGR